MARVDFDILVIGGGSGGLSAASLARGLGRKTALAERRKIGGDCTWFGCVPSKAFIRSARAAHSVRQLGLYGIREDGGRRLETSAVLEHVRSVREEIYQDERPEVWEAKGIRVLEGPVRFLDGHAVDVGGRRVTADKFIIATGSSPLIPPIEGVFDVPHLTNESFFEQERLPASLLVLGGGPIGIELAAASARLGVAVTVVEMASRILAREEEELVELLADQLEAEGVVIKTGVRAVRCRTEGDRVAVTVQAGSATEELEAEALLVAVGRRPNVGGLNLEAAGVRYSERGITTDDRLRTTAPNIFACGDVTGGYQFSHVAEVQATVAVRNAVLPLKTRIRYDHMVWSTFTDPELAHAGLTEEEARARYDGAVRVYRHPYEGIDRARVDRAGRGLAKVICRKDGKILGIHILGERATELMQELQLAKTLGVPLHKVAQTLHAYPGYSDLVKKIAAQYYADRLREHPLARVATRLFNRKSGS